jgi:hypothetical protein
VGSRDRKWPRSTAAPRQFADPPVGLTAQPQPLLCETKPDLGRMGKVGKLIPRWRFREPAGSVRSRGRNSQRFTAAHRRFADPPTGIVVLARPSAPRNATHAILIARGARRLATTPIVGYRPATGMPGRDAAGTAGWATGTRW